MSNDKITDLKAKFVAGAIPLDTDYATLLNMLEETRLATGTSPDTATNSDTGLTINNGTLSVKTAPHGLLSVDNTGIGLGLQARLRIAAGLMGDEEAYFVNGLKSYLVAVNTAHRCVFHFFPKEDSYIDAAIGSVKLDNKPSAYDSCSALRSAADTYNECVRSYFTTKAAVGMTVSWNVGTMGVDTDGKFYTVQSAEIHQLSAL